jgi:hypothetical protein
VRRKLMRIAEGKIYDGSLKASQERLEEFKVWFAQCVPVDGAPKV